MVRQAVAGFGLVVLGLSACAGLPMLRAAPPAYESTACGITQGGTERTSCFYPPGQRAPCSRVLAALVDLEAQRRKGELSELAFLTRAVAVLNGPDAIAVLAASVVLGQARAPVDELALDAIRELPRRAHLRCVAELAAHAMDRGLRHARVDGARNRGPGMVLGPNRRRQEHGDEEDDQHGAEPCRVLAAPRRVREIPRGAHGSGLRVGRTPPVAGAGRRRSHRSTWADERLVEPRRGRRAGLWIHEEDPAAAIAFGINDAATETLWLAKTSIFRIWDRAQAVAALGAYTTDWSLAELAVGLLAKLGPVPAHVGKEMQA